MCEIKILEIYQNSLGVSFQSEVCVLKSHHTVCQVTSDVCVDVSM